jgi:Protein of unknown function (DUF3429)
MQHISHTCRYGGQRGYSRLLLGVAPALVAWPTLALNPMTALAVQWVGFTSLWLADMRATAAGWSKPDSLENKHRLTIIV